MPIPEKQTQYYEKNLLDHVIDNVAAQKTPLSTPDLNRVAVAAQIQTGIDRYRAAAKTMDAIALEAEVHNSARLSRHLEEAGYKRPLRCHAHAIAAGNHPLSAQIRVIMASLRIRIDDTDNGCFLPENTAATPHPAFPSAPPHTRIHRFNYYFWTNFQLMSIATEPVFRARLQLIGKQLQQGAFPSYVLLSKGTGLPR